jgi:hypothetical protein
MKAARFLSISPASRPSIGINSMPKVGAMAWMAANCPMPEAVALAVTQRVSIWTLRPSLHPNCCTPLERCDAGLAFRIVRGQNHAHADPPHWPCLVARGPTRGERSARLPNSARIATSLRHQHNSSRRTPCPTRARASRLATAACTWPWRLRGRTDVSVASSPTTVRGATRASG